VIKHVFSFFSTSTEKDEAENKGSEVQLAKGMSPCLPDMDKENLK
jgi:hypothetical protein